MICPFIYSASIYSGSDHQQKQYSHQTPSGHIPSVFSAFLQFSVNDVHIPVQILAELIHVCIPLPDIYRHSFYNGIFCRIRQINVPIFGQWHNPVMKDPANRFFRTDPGQHKIHRGTDTVNICIWSLLGMGCILFSGGVATFIVYCHGFLIIGTQKAGSAKIDQNQSAILPKDQIVRCNIPVQKLFPVNHGQAVQYRLHQTQYRQRLHPALFIYKLLYCFAFDIFHHHITGFIFVEKIFDRNDTVKCPKSCKSPCFLNKLFQLCLKDFCGGTGIYLKISSPGHTHCVTARKIFLNRNLCLKHRIITQINNPHTALCDHILYPVPAMQDCFPRQPIAFIGIMYLCTVLHTFLLRSIPVSGNFILTDGFICL